MSLQKTMVKIAMSKDGVSPRDQSEFDAKEVKAWASKVLPVAITPRQAQNGTPCPGYYLTHTDNGFTVSPLLKTIKEGRAAIEFLEQETTPKDWKCHLVDHGWGKLYEFADGFYGKVMEAQREFFLNREV